MLEEIYYFLLLYMPYYFHIQEKLFPEDCSILWECPHLKGKSFSLGYFPTLSSIALSQTRWQYGLSIFIFVVNPF